MTVQLVGNAVLIVLDARPVRKGETHKDIIEDLRDSDQEFVHINEDRFVRNQEIANIGSNNGGSKLTTSSRNYVLVSNS